MLVLLEFVMMKQEVTLMELVMKDAGDVVDVDSLAVLPRILPDWIGPDPPMIQ